MQIFKKKLFEIIIVVIALISVLCGCSQGLSGLKEGINEDNRTFAKLSDDRKYSEVKDYKGYAYKMGDKTMTFRLKTPEKVEEGKVYPLIVFLHGAGDWGNDNKNQMYRSLITSVEKYVTEDCFVFLPQTSKKSCWAKEDEKGGYDNGDSDIYNEILDNYILKSYPVDKSRVYLTGMSMGGFGTIYQLYNYPQKYAAGMALCGWTDYKDLTPLKNMPLWVAHSDDDPSVNAVNSWFINAEMQRLGNENAKFTWYKNEGHQITQIFYDNKEVWDWLLQKRKSE